MEIHAGNKKAEPKPRFLDIEICRRFIRGRQIDRQSLFIATLRREYDGVSCLQSQRLMRARCVGALENLGQRFGLGGAVAFFGMQEDRPGFGIGLKLREWPVRQDEVSVSSSDVLQTVPARHAVAVGDLSLGRVAVSIGTAALQAPDIVGRQGFELDGHGETLRCR
ncbi:hypothetical protein X743_06905 [Mesorhizobium sp. LNHC252B00]|nr:hypothetical protein X743_06905 [Mesorhizobium sp. LNHC252B00]